jgi:hypothetical protein
LFITAAANTINPTTFKAFMAKPFFGSQRLWIYQNLKSDYADAIINTSPWIMQV